MSEWAGDLCLDGSGPVYDQIRRAILGNIRAGIWPPRHRIPAEAELAAHFGTARMTVNRALRGLTEDGLIVRRRRAGSFVAQPPSPAAMLEIVDMSTAIPARGQVYGYQCLTDQTVAASPERAAQMQVATGAPLQHLVCRHTADGDVIELEERWINLALLPSAADQDFRATAPGAWLLSATPWTAAEHTVLAINADARLAGLLEIRRGDACLVLERRTFQNEAVVTFARLTHPGDRHVMTERFAPAG
ncbi:histidine utilization repressor [uncultured Maricaulis sp.]|uniref:histidine utilization repressor n=1 Tax=uncultured Maricaulis sp. TaxID=174710 RepID=UPI0030D88F2C|tara:strand:- start:188260 stop:189000 length:741 start_codon:yes stop_codon:yes gene_type:complete